MNDFLVKFTKTMKDNEEIDYRYEIGDKTLPVDLLIVGAFADRILQQHFDTSTMEEIDQMKDHLFESLFGGIEENE